MLDSQNFWRVVAYRASVLSTDGNGQPWDTFGSYAAPDAYARLTIAGVSNTTAVDYDTYQPLWNQSLIDAKASVIKSSTAVSVYDSDLLTAELIGSCSPVITDADLLAGSKLIKNCGRCDITLLFFSL